MLRSKLRRIGSVAVLVLAFAVVVQATGSAVVSRPGDGDVLRVGPFSQALPGGALPSGWRPLEFQRIDRTTDYRLVEDDGVVVVRADSRNAASGLTRSLDLDPRERPVLEWRWRVDDVLEGGDVTRREGDDYPARLYVAFAFDPAQAGALERVQFEMLRLVYGEYPPRAAINYIWASKSPVGTVVPNPYSERATMVVVDSGAAHRGEWRSHRRNVVDDYEAFVGGPMPRIAGIAIMTDTDDTGESARAWFGDIVLRAAAEEGDRPARPGQGEDRLEGGSPSHGNHSSFASPGPPGYRR